MLIQRVFSIRWWRISDLVFLQQHAAQIVGSDVSGIFLCLWCSGTPGGSQWPVWRTDWPGEDCQEDHAPCPDIAKVRALLCSAARGHWVTGMFFVFSLLCVCVCVCVSVCLSVWYICAVVEGNKAHLLKYCTQIPNILTVYKVVKTYFTSSIHNSKILLTHSRALLPYNSLCYVEYFRPMLLVTLLYQSRISNAALLPNFFLHCRTCTLMLCKT